MSAQSQHGNCKHDRMGWNSMAPVLALTIATTAISSPVSAAPEYVSSIIERPAGSEDEDSQNFRDITFADVNGDGKKDVLWSGWSEKNGRELFVYEQNSSGQFSNEPSQRIEIKKEIVAYAVTDVRDTPGEELIFITGSAAYSYSTRIPGYSGNIKKLFDWPLIQSVPHKKRVHKLGKLIDLNGDNKKDLLLPAIEQFGVFYRGDGEIFEYAGMVPKAYMDPNRIGNQFFSTFDILFAEGPYKDLRELPKKERDRQNQQQGNTLNRGNWIAMVKPARIHADQLTDFVFLDDPIDGEKPMREFNIARQSSNGTLPGEPDRTFPIELKDQVQAVSVIDLNNDQLDDVYTKTNDTLSFYLNKNGSFNFEKADQVLKFGQPTGVAEQIIDLDNDGYPELCATTYSFAMLSAMVTGDMNNFASDQNIFIYKNLFTQSIADGKGGGDIFGRRPVSKVQNRILAIELMNASKPQNALTSFVLPRFINEFNDGRTKVAVMVDKEGALNLHEINSELNIDAASLWRFVPQHAIWGFEADKVNDDSTVDFVLNHEDAITVLVSK